MCDRRFTILVESTLLSSKHKCAIAAANLHEFKRKLLEAVGLTQVGCAMQLEVWDAQFMMFVLLSDLSLMGAKAKVKVSPQAEGVGEGGASAALDNANLGELFGEDGDMSRHPYPMSQPPPSAISQEDDLASIWSTPLYVPCASMDSGSNELGLDTLESLEAPKVGAKPKSKKMKKPKRKKTPQEEGLDGVNTGTWTDGETRLFIEGLQKYGKNWPRIQKELIRTRTLAQIRSHAQKFFLKVRGWLLPPLSLFLFLATAR